jgi:DNA-binding winged helix-turn-helix (wHTH) protein
MYSTETYILADNIVVTTKNNKIKIDNCEIELRPQCSKLLLLLVEAAEFNSYASFCSIGETLWYEEGGWGEDKKQSLKDCVTELRKYVPYITSVRGQGYKLACSVVRIPNMIIEHIGHARTKSFFEFEIEKYEIKTRELREQLSLVEYLVSNLIGHINKRVQEQKEDTIHFQELKKQLFKSKVSLESVIEEIRHKRMELSEIEKKVVDLTRKLKTGAVSYDDTEIDRMFIKETYRYIAEWCFDAKIQVKELKLIIDEALGIKVDFQMWMSILKEETEE